MFLISYMFVLVIENVNKLLNIVKVLLLKAYLMKKK